MDLGSPGLGPSHWPAGTQVTGDLGIVPWAMANALRAATVDMILIDYFDNLYFEGALAGEAAEAARGATKAV